MNNKKIQIKKTMRHLALKGEVCDRRSSHQGRKSLSAVKNQRFLRFGCSRNYRTLKGAVFVKFLDITNKINIKSTRIYLISSLLLIILINLISSAPDFTGYSSSASYTSPASYRTNYETYYSSSDIQTYWPILNDKDSCKARQDLILQVAPAGCQPAVVRSDLLAEQNVPVFCQINALKLNPLIEVKEINYIRFIGKYPKDVISAGFHPARAALRTRDKLLGSPLIDNIGYAVIILKKNEKESELPDFVTVNLSGKIEYEAGNPLGIGRTEFILSEQDEESWLQEKDRQSFWNGRYFLRLERADPNTADISIYKGDNKVSTVRVERGKASNEIYLPGSYCQAGLQAFYEGFVAEEKRAKIEISSDSGSEVIDIFKGSRILNNKCIVERIDISKGGTGDEVIYLHDGKEEKAAIKTVYDNDRYEIEFNKKKITVSGDSLKALGQARISETGKVQINCGYRERIVLQIRNVESSIIGKEVTYIENGNKKTAIVQSIKDGKYIIQLTEAGADKPKTVSPSEIKFRDKVIAEDKKLESPEAELAFEEAIKAYEDIADNYPAEKVKSGTEETFGEKALEAAIKLSQNNGKTQTEARLLSKIIDLYPLAENIESYKQRLNEVYTVDSSLAGNIVYVDNKYRTLRLLDLSEPFNKAYAEFIVGTNSLPIKVEIKSETVLPSSTTTRTSTILEKIRLDYLDADEARITAFCRESNRARTSSSGASTAKTETHTFRISDSGKDLCGQIVSLNKINVSEVAKIILNPLVRGADSEVNLTVRVGIEKRAIKLSPDKTEEMIENMNKSIEKWESISKGLEKAVTGMKAACFATAAVLQAKTFLTGLSGEGVARQTVMRGEKGWNIKCQEIVAKGQAANLNDCFLKNSAQINADVKATAEAINGINSKIKEIEKPLKTSSGVFGALGLESSVDRTASAKGYATYLTTAYKGRLVPDKEGNLVPIESLINVKDGYDKGEYTYDQLKQYELYLRLQRSGASETAKENYKLEAERTSERIQQNIDDVKEFEKAKELASQGFPQPISSRFTSTPRIFADIGQVSKLPTDISSKFTSDNIDYVANYPISGYNNKGVNFNRGSYLLGLEKKDNGEYGVKKIIHVQDGKFVKELSPTEMNQFVTTQSVGTIASQTSVKYNNRYQNPEVKYFETEPYKGMPAIVPFDTLRGWYAATKQNMPVFGGIGAFESSGRVASFYLCNVGDKGREQFQEGFGDDICELINLNTGQPLNQFPGLDETQARTLVGRAINALTEAANQYKNSIVRIQGESFKVGKPALNIPATQCQDFMDPKDCYLMFNVCDPVICPASRCDFGGRYPVADVIQTGIVGSTLLCLPNVKEKIIVPVCLTGIQAGVDGYVSIIKNHRDCLQENLATGRTVGICDQIYSIYACEFFWRQVAPVANVLLPKLVEVAYGRGGVPRGGGEYATVAGAWQNTQKSINYFTNTYAVNSLKAFQLRSIEEAGTPFCKAFVSAKAPTSFKSLIEPDSPPQFHAWFSSIKHSDATIPATAQYKVFYHIFAGKDSGIQYRVYLKGAPEGSYYYTSPVLHLASGFIARGEYRSETIDRTAPEGYKELCVDINGEEKCGFKEVSTSFAVNYLRDQYANEQIKAGNIVSEKECISGEASLGAILANTNPQAAAEEAALPQIYNRGIVRICASQNPGSATEPTRFTDMGYCDDPKIRCWLDKNSIKNAITENNKYLQNKTLSEINDIQRKALEDKALILPQDKANLQIDQFRREVAFIIAPNYESADTPALLKTDIEAEIKKIDNAFGENLEMLFFNHHKAEVSLIKAQLKGALAESYSKQGKKQEAKTAVPPTIISPQISEFKVGDEVLYKGKNAIIQSINGDTYIVQPIGELSKDEGEAEAAKRSDLSLIIKKGTSVSGAGPETGSGTDSEKLVKQIVNSNEANFNGYFLKKEIAGDFNGKEVEFVYYKNEGIEKKLDIFFISTSSGGDIYARDDRPSYKKEDDTAQYKKVGTYDSEGLININDLNGIADPDRYQHLIALNGKNKYGIIYSSPSDVTKSNEETKKEFTVGDAVEYYGNEAKIISIDGKKYTIKLEETGETIEVPIIDIKISERTSTETGSKRDTENNNDLVRTAERSKWTLDSAIKEVKKRSGSYTDNKKFIDELYEDKIISEEEHSEINGEGLFNLEENMKYVRDLLLKKKLQEPNWGIVVEPEKTN